MINFTAERDTARNLAQSSFDWQKRGQVFVSLNSGQWWEPKSLYWDDPKRRFNVQLEKLMRNSQLGCGNFPIMLIDYGDILIPALFGAEIGDVDGGPWIHHLLPEISAQRKLSRPSFDTPLGQHILRTVDYFAEHCPTGITLLPPHKLSPFGNAHLIRGNDLFIDLYDNPKEVHELLLKVTEAFIYAFEFLHARLGMPIVPGVSPNGFPLPGIFIGDDSSITLSPGHIAEFDLEYIHRLTKHFGAPAFMHYCVMNDTQGLQLLQAYRDADLVIGLNNQYGPDFFLDHYEEHFQHRLFLATESSPASLGSTPDMRLKRFSQILARLQDEMSGKNGLLYFVDGIAEDELPSFVTLKREFEGNIR